MNPYTITIPVPSRHVKMVKEILAGHKINEVGPAGGPGWIMGDGEVSISGRELDVCRVSTVIKAYIRIKQFHTGVEVQALHKQGALP